MFSRTLAAAFVAFATVALGLIGGTAASAQPATVSGVDDFTFESFDADYYLSRDQSGRARLRVVETIVARFPDYDQNRGLVRAIPLHSLDYDLNPSIVSVTDGTGGAVHYDRTDDDEFAELSLGTDAFVHGRTTYVIEYTMDDPIRAFRNDGDNVDEFYWDINGDGWWQPFDRVTSTVHLSDDLVASLSGAVSCYSGYSGSEECELVTTDGGSTFTQTTTNVGFRSTVTVAIGFEPGVVVQPQLAKDSWIVKILPIALVLAMAFIVLLSFFVRFAVWRDAKGTHAVIAQYSVPQELDPLISAAILRRPKSAMTAHLLDLAVRGHVRLIDRTPDSTVDDNYDLELVEATGATDVDLRVLTALFGTKLEPGELVSLDHISATKGTALYNIAKAGETRARTQKLFATVKSRSAVWIRRAALLVIAGHVVTWVFAIVNGVGEDLVVGTSVGSIVLAIVASVVLLPPSRLTVSGADARDYLYGVRDYLELAEAERLRALQSPSGAERVDVNDRGAVVKLNEKLLPYAVLFGIEEEWARQLEIDYDLVGDRPGWYSTTSTSMNLARTLLRVRSGVSTHVRAPAPVSSSSSGSWSGSSSSSSSSGSSGGGSSGGGSGGGGGGGR